MMDKNSKFLIFGRAHPKSRPCPHPSVMQLLKKNPIGAIPVALRRLKQKDLEWRKARQDLNKQVICT